MHDCLSELLPFASSPTAAHDYYNDGHMAKHYKHLCLLGKGMFGSVYLVCSSHSSCGVYAQKVVQKSEIICNATQFKVVHQERRILTFLNEQSQREGEEYNPFIIRLLRTYETKDELHLVMDYFSGGDLFFHLKKVPKRRFEVRRVRLYAAQILSALHHLHRLEIAHRDLKAENVLLDSRGCIKLIDFGLALGGKLMGHARYRQHRQQPGERRVLTWDKGAYTCCGTPEYMAPEVGLTSENGCKGKNGCFQYGYAIDLWSLGVLVYFMLFGKLPAPLPKDRKGQRKQQVDKAIDPQRKSDDLLIPGRILKLPFFSNPILPSYLQLILVEEDKTDNTHTGDDQLEVKRDAIGFVRMLLSENPRDRFYQCTLKESNDPDTLVSAHDLAPSPSPLSSLSPPAAAREEEAEPTLSLLRHPFFDSGGGRAPKLEDLPYCTPPFLPAMDSCTDLLASTRDSSFSSSDRNRLPVKRRASLTSVGTKGSGVAPFFLAGPGGRHTADSITTTAERSGCNDGVYICDDVVAATGGPSGDGSDRDCNGDRGTKSIRRPFQSRRRTTGISVAMTRCRRRSTGGDVSYGDNRSSMTQNCSLNRSRRRGSSGKKPAKAGIGGGGGGSTGKFGWFYRLMGRNKNSSGLFANAAYTKSSRNSSTTTSTSTAACIGTRTGTRLRYGVNFDRAYTERRIDRRTCPQQPPPLSYSSLFFSSGDGSNGGHSREGGEGGEDRTDRDEGMDNSSSSSLRSSSGEGGGGDRDGAPGGNRTPKTPCLLPSKQVIGRGKGRGSPCGHRVRIGGAPARGEPDHPSDFPEFGYCLDPRYLITKQP